jgi:long-subunit acyl-CoA synthetase (AMP-forming)
MASVAGSYARRLGIDPDARVVSCLPWHHAFGLLTDLLPAILGGATLWRDGDESRDAAALAEILRDCSATHFSSVPYVIRRFSALSGGTPLLRSLRGGVVSGAPVAADLAELLCETNLRAGYGQTEAAAGVTLGEPGQWSANFIGEPLGCEVRIDQGGALHVRGPNVCLGFWNRQDRTLQQLSPHRWINTGDLAAPSGDGLRFLGRADHSFALDADRRELAGPWESLVRDRFPGVEEAVLYSRDGRSIELGLSMRPPADLPEPAAVRPLLGPLADRLRGVRPPPLGGWPRTTKGDVDRFVLSQQAA